MLSKSKKIELCGYFTHGLVLQRKIKAWSHTITLVTNSGIHKSTSLHKCTGGKAILFELMRLNSKA